MVGVSRALNDIGDAIAVSVRRRQGSLGRHAENGTQRQEKRDERQELPATCDHRGSSLESGADPPAKDERVSGSKSVTGRERSYFNFSNLQANAYEAGG
jgi:hypothetical protein